ncbi:MAG: FAD-binding oxidoreductase [Devosia sp.]
MTASLSLSPGSTIAVVGAGVIGVSVAFALVDRGYRVTLFDRAEPGRAGPSYGNAGHVVGSAIEPLASPGIATTGLRMLLDPEGALKIPKAYAASVLPWLWRFWRSSLAPTHGETVKTLTAFNAGVLADMEALFARAGIGTMLRLAPAIHLYESETSFGLARGAWALRRSAGLNWTLLDAAQIRELEPRLAPIFVRGILDLEWAIVTDPHAVVEGLFAAGQARGAHFVRANVHEVRPTARGIVVVSAGAEQPFDAAVIAAGVWSRHLAQALGDVLPVEAERGYNLTFHGLQHLLRNPLVFSDRGMVATSLAPGLRIGGWTELGGTELPPTTRYWQSMRRICEALVPGVGDAEASEWMGHRPSMPDSIPVISRSGYCERVFYSVGHGHYGLSQSAKTARALTELISEGRDREWSAHSIGRFI